MIRNYIKTAWRNILNNKFYAAINVTGLTVGLVVGLFMLLWVQDELSFDRFNKQSDNIYKIAIEAGTGLSKQIFNNIIAPVAPFAKNEIPEVKDAMRISGFGNLPVAYKDKVFVEDNACFTDASYFSMLDFPLTEGNKKDPFPDINSVVISQKTAGKLFGNQQAVGKMITIGKDELVKVTGVIPDYPENSSFKYDILLPIARYNYYAYVKNTTSYDGKTRVASMDADWSNFGIQTYLLVKPNTDVRILTKKLQAIHERQKPEDAPVPYLAQALPAMHLYKADGTDDGYSTVRTFAIVAIMILVIACINYINLSTARSMLRAKEVSMRKIIGAGKLQLFIQFMAETALLFLIATGLALVLMYLLLPYFNQFTTKHITLTLSAYNVWLCIALTLVGTLAASSIYPAILLSSFEPLKALKGKISAGIGNVAFRRALVIVQFSVSVILIIGTIIIGRQLSYMMNKDLGYNRENTLTFMMNEDMHKNFNSIKNELLKDGGVTAVTRSSRSVLTGGPSTGDNDWDGKPAKDNLWFNQLHADENFIKFFNLKVKEGTAFTGAVADSSHFLINETAVKEMGLKEPVVGKRLRIQTVNGTIIGVVKDFHFASLHQTIEPMVFQYKPESCWRVYVKTTNGNAQRAIQAAQKQWSSYHSNGIPFNYAFLDDSVKQLYSDDERQGELFNIFSGIAILISCLGLFGLATYSAQVKTREIGIRKVLGASIARIIALLATEFMVLISIAILIAAPIAWYTMNHWLQDFAYKITIGWSAFIIAGLGATAIALATISTQSVKAALANPVKSLKDE